MIRRVLAIAILALFAFGELAPALLVSEAWAQEAPVKKRRTLFDFIFGSDQEPEPPPQVVKKVKKAALPVPAKPKIEKAATATRLAVFGDSLAVDLASALERFYAEDPNITIINQGVGSSGFARPDFFDWPKTIGEQIEKNSFDIAVFIIGINDRQTMTIEGESYASLTPEWLAEYSSRAARFAQQLRTANKPLVWVGLPPVAPPKLAKTMLQVNEIDRLAAFGAGAEFVDIYDKFVNDDGVYATSGPDLAGNTVRMRKDDGIHFTAAGADKLAYYLSQSLKAFYRGGGSVGIEVADVLAGTDAALMVRPPYQGLGQIRLLEVAGAVIPLNVAPKRATDLVTAGAVVPTEDDAFDMSKMIGAPQGRVDDFGVGVVPEAPPDTSPSVAAAE